MSQMPQGIACRVLRKGRLMKLTYIVFCFRSFTRHFLDRKSEVSSPSNSRSPFSLTVAFPKSWHLAGSFEMLLDMDPSIYMYFGQTSHAVPSLSVLSNGDFRMTAAEQVQPGLLPNEITKSTGVSHGFPRCLFKFNHKPTKHYSDFRKKLTTFLHKK